MTPATTKTIANMSILTLLIKIDLYPQLRLLHLPTQHLKKSSNKEEMTAKILIMPNRKKRLIEIFFMHRKTKSMISLTMKKLKKKRRKRKRERTRKRRSKTTVQLTFSHRKTFCRIRALSWMGILKIWLKK